MSETEDIITVEEAARIMKVAARTVSRYRLEGRLPYIQYSPRKFNYRRIDIVNFIQASYHTPVDYCE